VERILTQEEEQNVVELTKNFIKYPSSIWDDDKVYQYAFDYLNKKGYKPEKGDSETYSIENSEGFFIWIQWEPKANGYMINTEHMKTMARFTDWAQQI
jgi:hypothetical protein